MQKQITLSVPEDVYHQAEQMATATRSNVATVMADAIIQTFAPYPVNPQRAAMQQEIAAYEAMHPELVREFLGQYVAIYQSRVVDHDIDPIALHRRISSHYAGKVVLSRKVQKNPKPILHMRSPRLEQLP